MKDAKENRILVRAYELWERDGQQGGPPEFYRDQAKSEIDAEDAEPGNENPKASAEDAPMGGTIGSGAMMDDPC